MDKYGFVYRWYDRKHDRYYIGCHWGQDFDGYICSSNWMRNSYRKRPEDFTREILKTDIPSKEETLDEEYKWLQMIKEEELGKKYYNLHIKRFPFGPHISPNKGKPMSEEQKLKIGLANKGKGGSWRKGLPGHKWTEETRQKLSGPNHPFYGKSSPRKGTTLTQEQKDYLSVIQQGKHNSPRTEFKKGQEAWNKIKEKPLDFNPTLPKRVLSRQYSVSRDVIRRWISEQ